MISLDNIFDYCTFIALYTFCKKYLIKNGLQSVKSLTKIN